MKEYEAVLKIFLCWISICGNYHFISRHGNNKVSFASVLWELILSISTRPSFVLHPATSRMLLKSYWEFAHLVNIPSVQMYFHEEYAWTESLSRTQRLILHGDPPHKSAPWIPLKFQKKKINTQTYWKMNSWSSLMLSQSFSYAPYPELQLTQALRYKPSIIQTMNICK